MTDAPAITPRMLDGLAAIAADYDAALVDIWGVIHNGRTPFLDAIEACRRFRAERGPVVLISNSPRPSDAIPAQMAAIGAGTDFFDGIVTSGDATRAVFAARAPGPAFKLGPDRDDPIYDGTGLTFAPLEAATFISCTGLFDDENEGPDDYRDLLDAAKARDLDLVCANPDVTVLRGTKLIYCAGALAEAYAGIGGRVVLCGKPHAPIYALARERLVAAGAATDARILAVGDGPLTDLRGAATQGLDALFVIAGLDPEAAAADPVAAAAAALRAAATSAAYAAPTLRW